MKRILGCGLLAATAVVSYGQAVSVNGGSIAGTITDATGAIVSNAPVLLKGIDTGLTKSLTTDSAGFYSIGPLNPGNYTVTVAATGFQKLTVTTVVRTGTVTSGNFKLTIGETSQTVEVNAGALQINTEQAGVSDVMTREQIDSLPINGRNFLDIAQIQPGVILQSGETFDPTKAGYSSISVGGVSGRTTRILLDGQDITDETVGTTIMNVTTGAIDEFQLNRSTQDVSGEVTSTGQVLVSTRSGTNNFHGQLFYNFQDHRVAFARTTGGFDAPFQRNQFGGAMGGPIIKDKLFFFGDSERLKQDSRGSATTSPTFAAIQAQYPLIPAPFRDTYSTARIDYNGPKGAHFFVRGAYNVNSANASYQELYSLYQSRNNVPALVGGMDFTTGRFTHSFRGGYEKFHNVLTDGTVGQKAIYNPLPTVTLADDSDLFYAGPNFLAPQGTFQSDKQLRYDGTWTHGAHNVKFGASLNRILGGGFAAFYGPSLYTQFGPANAFSGPTASSPNAPGCGGVGGAAACPGDPINGYSARDYILGNGNGGFTEVPAFGLPGGGVQDWRTGAYVADSWKATSSLTVIAGVRWSTDTDRANQDIASPLCSSVTSTLQFSGCSSTSGANTYLYDQFAQGLGGTTHQPYRNFGPQAGFVFSPGTHKMSLRGGAGIFYESDVFNNTGSARPAAVQSSGAFFNYAVVCGGTYSLPLPGGGSVNSVNGVPLSTICSESIAQASPQINQLKAAYQAASATPGANPSFIGNGGALKATGVYGKPYVTPYSIQFNGGIQQELMKGMILTVDYVHNATIKVPLNIDVNHVGAARYLNTASAKAAINATLAQCGASTVAQAIASCQAHPGGPGTANGGATLADFAGNGLDSGGIYTGGYPGSAFGLTSAAFGGANPNVGLGEFIIPAGRSGYDALQAVFKQKVSHPAPGILRSDFQASYSLSRVVNPIGVNNNNGNNGDQFFTSLPFDFDHPMTYLGRSALDHTNELSFGGGFTVKYGLNVGLTGHFYSAPPSTLTLDNSSGAPGEIFRTDVTGDGTTGDVLPGTLPGYYMHQVKGDGLNNVIKAYNATSAGQPTPAGQALIAAGLFTAQQLAAIGAVQQPIALAPTTPLSNSAFRALDLSVSYPVRMGRLREGLSIEPAVSMYNAANMSNFSRLTGQLANVTTAGGPVGTTNNFLNGPNTTQVQNGQRTQRSSGTFDQGAPRTTEFQLKVNF